MLLILLYYRANWRRLALLLIISNDDMTLMDQSNVEEERVTVILPADEEYSTYFELNTTCEIMRNISSYTFSESQSLIVWCYPYS